MDLLNADFRLLDVVLAAVGAVAFCVVILLWWSSR
jgi:CHASE3 domain sensor protein